MIYRFIQHPHALSAAQYESAITRMTERVAALRGVQSVTQVGGTGTPGISDIDFYVVFDDRVSMTENPVSGLEGEDKYLFTHHLFGTSESLALTLEQYTFFGKYKLLAGKEFLPAPAPVGAEAEPMRAQVALEYLVKAWMTIHVERSYGVVKVRNLFLVSKALLHDLALLHTDSGPLWEVLQELVQCRNRWLQKPLTPAELSGLVDRYAMALEMFLEQALLRHVFYLPHSRIAVSRNVLLVHDRKLSIRAAGLSIPAFLLSMHPKAFNLQHRLRRFEAGIPCQVKGAPDSILRRHRRTAEAVAYNRKNLPAFVPTAYGLNIFDPQQN